MKDLRNYLFIIYNKDLKLIKHFMNYCKLFNDL